MTEQEEKKSPIQKYNEMMALGDPEAQSFEPFPSIKKEPEKKQDDNSEGEESTRASLGIARNENIRLKNEKGLISQQLAGRDEVIDHVAEYGVKHTTKVAKTHALIFEDDLEGALTRKILFKLTNYILIAASIIIALMSGSNPSIKAAISNLTASPVELLGLAAFVSLDIYIYFRYFKGR